MPITSVVAPVGYGKTTLLSEWAQREDTRVAWLSLDRFDNDLGLFVSYLTEALARVGPIDEALLGLVNRRTSVAAAASGVAAALAALGEPVTLMLDHVESLENRECLDTVAELALHLPPGARLAIATRFDPPLPVPRLRAGGAIVEIGVDELAMDDDEATLLLEQAGVRLSDGDLHQVIDRAEGWPVGLYLAALALNRGGSRETAGVRFSGNDRLVAEYLRAELLDHLSRDDLRFLTRTAVVDRMSGSLCDAVRRFAGLVTGARDARAVEPAARPARSGRVSGTGITTSSVTFSERSWRVVNRTSSRFFMPARRIGSASRGYPSGRSSTRWRAATGIASIASCSHTRGSCTPRDGASPCTAG